MNFTKILVLISCFSFLSLAEPVEDNSFLVEEAYNQDPGVVQFINVYQKSNKAKDWNYVFINELPILSRDHQFSYELPYSHVESTDKTGLGDVKLNYRYEIYGNEKFTTTGRLSYVTTTGKFEDGLGAGVSSYEASLVTSVKISEKWVQHWNVGASHTPKAKIASGDTADNNRFFWNLSNVYLLTDSFNFMLEFASSQKETTTGKNQTEWGSQFIVSPSIRYGIDIGEWQIVPGLALPSTIGPNPGTENQTLVYLSIEGKLW